MTNGDLNSDTYLSICRLHRKSQTTLACSGCWAQTGTFILIDSVISYHLYNLWSSPKELLEISRLCVFLCVCLRVCVCVCVCVEHCRDIILQSTPTDDPHAFSNLYILTGHESSYWAEEEGVGQEQFPINNGHELKTFSALPYILWRTPIRHVQTASPLWF